MAASRHSSKGRSRRGRMLRTALGSAICRFLEDAAIVELMRPHLIDRLSEGLPDTGKRLSTGDGERIVRLAAHHVGAEVHASAPRGTFYVSASALIDVEHKADLEKAGEHFESSYFLTFCHLPHAEDDRAEAWLYEGREKTGIDPHEVMSGFAIAPTG